MKLRGLFLYLFLLAAIAEENRPPLPIPQAYPIERYEPIWKLSPFTRASVAEATPEDTTQYALGALSGIGTNGFVVIINKDSQERIIVRPDVNEKGYRLLSVSPKNDLYESSAVIQKGDDQIIVKFDKNLVATTTGAPSFNPSNPFGNPSGTPGFIPPPTLPAPQISNPVTPGVSSSPQPRPIRRRIIPARPPQPPGATPNSDE